MPQPSLADSGESKPRARQARRWLRVLAIAFLALVAVVATTGWYARRQLSTEALTSEISALVLRSTGFQLSIGELKLTWTGDVRLQHICLKNPQLVSDRCFVSANVLSLDLSLLPLLRKQVVVRGAHIDSVAINLFTEKKVEKGKPDQQIGSWQAPDVTKDPSHVPASTTRLSLQKIHITNGVLAHEVKLLPIPIGNTSFFGELAKWQAYQIQGSLNFPAGSGITANLKINSENLLRFLKEIATTRSFAASDRIEGSLQCQACDLSALDARLHSLTGQVNLRAEGNRWKVISESSRIATQGALKLSLLWAGSLDFDLQLPSIIAGQGKLSGPGISIDYSTLLYDQREGLRVNFGVAAELSNFASVAGDGKTLAGQATISGSYRKTGLDAGFRIAKFRAGKSAVVEISSESLQGALTSSTASLNSQSLSLNGQTFETTSVINFKEKVPLVTGRAIFGTLNLDKLWSTAPAGAGESAAASSPSTSVSLPLRLQLAVQSKILKVNQIELEGVAAQLQTDGPLIRIEKISATLARGQVSGGYSYDLATRKQTARFALSQVRAHDLSQALKLKATVFGQIDGRIDAAFMGSDIAQVMKTVSGTVIMTVGRGKIKDSFLQKGILNGPLHKLEEKFSDTEFESATVDASFRSGALSLKRLYFDASEFNVSMRAEAAAGGQGKATLNFRFRTSFVENVANPLHMGIEGLREGDFYDLPFACRGDVFIAECYKRNW